MIEKPDGNVIQIGLQWQDASDLPTLYANQMYMIHSAGEFYVIFGETQLPIMLNRTPEDIENLETIEVKPVAKLVFTPQSIAAIANVMVGNIQAFQIKQEMRKEESDVPTTDNG